MRVLAMEGSYPDGFISIDEAFEEACQCSNECQTAASPVVEMVVDPEHFVQSETWAKVSDKWEVLNPEGRDLKRWTPGAAMAPFSPIDHHDAAKLGVWRKICEAVLSKALPVYVEIGEHPRRVDVYPDEWDEARFIPGAGVDRHDRDGRTQLFKVSYFQELFPVAFPEPTVSVSIVALEGDELFEKIRSVIHAINRKQGALGGKKLNIIEQRTATMRELRVQGIQSRSGGLQGKVRAVLDEPEFKASRGPVGVRNRVAQ
jgi:hypothetical protein